MSKIGIANFVFVSICRANRPFRKKCLYIQYTALSQANLKLILFFFLLFALVNNQKKSGKGKEKKLKRKEVSGFSLSWNFHSHCFVMFRLAQDYLSTQARHVLVSWGGSRKMWACQYFCECCDLQNCFSGPRGWKTSCRIRMYNTMHWGSSEHCVVHSNSISWHLQQFFCVKIQEIPFFFFLKKKSREKHWCRVFFLFL